MANEKFENDHKNRVGHISILVFITCMYASIPVKHKTNGISNWYPEFMKKKAIFKDIAVLSYALGYWDVFV